MLDENKIRQIARQEIQQAAGNSVFQMSNIPFHIHNGKDSPYVLYTPNVFMGVVDNNGVMLCGPSGWASSNPSPGRYVITHNLNSTQYAATATVLSGLDVFSIKEYAPNFVDIEMFSLPALASGNSIFSFILVLGNQSLTTPKYNGSVIFQG